MKHDTLLLPKFKRLARLLGGSVMAAGTLEVLWRTCDTIQRFTFTAEEVEDVCEWAGNPGKLVGILTACRWLDREGDLFVVHDYLNNAPEFIQERHRKREEYNRRLAEKRGENRRTAEKRGNSPEFSGPTDTDTDTDTSTLKEDVVKNADTERLRDGGAQRGASGSVSGSADLSAFVGGEGPQSIAGALDKMLGGRQGAREMITKKAAEIVGWTGEGPEYVEWWGKVIEVSLAGEFYGEVAESLDYARSCVLEGKAKDLGALRNPGAFVVSQITPIFHRHSRRLPRVPRASPGDARRASA